MFLIGEGSGDPAVLFLNAYHSVLEMSLADNCPASVASILCLRCGIIVISYDAVSVFFVEINSTVLIILIRSRTGEIRCSLCI